MAQTPNAASERDTTRLSEDTPTLPPSAPPHSAARSAIRQLSLLLQDERDVLLNLTDRAIIGRADEADGFIPEIDLAPFHGRDKGVSRRHAEFILREGQLHLRDLGSTNGTRLNGQPLQPNRLYCLREGDLLQLGNIYLRVKLSQPSQ